LKTVVSEYNKIFYLTSIEGSLHCVVGSIRNSFLRSSIFWDIQPLRGVTGDRRFQTALWFYLFCGQRV